MGFSYSVYSQTSSFSFTQISSGTEVVGPGRGAEQWMHLPWDNGSGHGVQIPAGNTTPGPNFYTRFAWKDIESDATQGSYSWTEFDRRFHQAMDAHQMFSFGVMPICSGCGSASFIPAYLHKLMQAESTLKDWYYSADGAWIPNWNSNSYLSRYKALLQAIANHIATTSYKPSWSSVAIPYASVVYYVDIRGYGNYGEWHTYPWMDDGAYPANAHATATTLQTLIDYNLQIFPNYPNVILMNAFTNTSASFVPAQTTYYALTAMNSWGQIGWRRDNFGDPQYSSILENNPETYNPGSGSVALSTLIMNKWKYAPITGEPLGGLTSSYTCGSPYCHIITEVNLYHVTSFGNGNLASPGSSTTQANIIQASRIAGYRLILTGGTMNTALTPGSAFNISLNWQNIGLAPTYENWNVVYELRNSSGGVVWTSISSFKPKLFLPSTTPTVVSENFTLPATVSSGTYGLYLIIRDPSNYKNPLSLAITGRNTDGSYLLRSNMTVGSASNLPPTVNAGTDQTIQLPTSTAKLTGTATDADGSVSSLAWSIVSGPAGSTISSPTSATTNITGLVQGVYVYRFTATDNKSAKSTDDLQITVNAAPPSNQSPVAKAGTDITITQPASSTTLNGSSSSDPDGSISTYAWTKISGPTQYSLANSSAATTALSNLVLGTYSFRLRVTDNAGATASDTILVTVKAANQNPIAKAGTDITITQPASSTTLNGSSSSDPDGSISTYAWTKISGPTQYSLANSSAATTTLSNLVLGTYSFRLRVTDNTGATASDTILVTVKAANQNPVAKAGTDITITQPASSTTLNGSSSSDPDGSISTYAWTKISGPTQYSLANNSAATTALSNLVVGTYSFRLRVTDNAGATASDTILVTVKAANQNPVANAGADITITLPTNRANLNGSGSNDPNGSITSYAWTKISGPSQYAIANASSANTSISNLVQGIYYFRLTVTDNAGATDTDNVKVTVNASSTSSQQVAINDGLSGYDTLNVTFDAAPATLIENQVPVAIAGENMTIPLTYTSITLNGASSYDPDGSITAYAWKQVSGTYLATIMNAASASTEVNRLVEGSYVFELDVTDNSGALSSAIVMVDVVNTLRLTQSLKIYPNPVSSILNFQYLSDLTGRIAVDIFSSNGALMFSTEYNKDQSLLLKQIDMRKSSKGLYYIKVIQPDGTKLSKSFFKR